MTKLRRFDETDVREGCGATGFSFVAGAKWYRHTATQLSLGSYKRKQHLSYIPRTVFVFIQLMWKLTCTQKPAYKCVKRLYS